MGQLGPFGHKGPFQFPNLSCYEWSSLNAIACFFQVWTDEEGAWFHCILFHVGSIV